MESDHNNGGECGICCGVSFKSDWDNTAKPSLTHFMPLSLSIPPESITKPLLFWCFQGVSKETTGMKWVNTISNTFIQFSHGFHIVLLCTICLFKVSNVLFLICSSSQEMSSKIMSLSCKDIFSPCSSV